MTNTKATLPAHGPGERKICEDRSEQHDAEQRPAAVDVLHHEIIGFAEKNLVRQREQMRAERHERQCGQHDCQKFEGSHPVTVPDWTRPST
ncbi:MAG TPA: hypothetical protein VFN63_11325 [Pseudolabrys sp.]|jgi:hypothetical protein|nr:hypothetical protein [Pseudolabrys sp.]